MKKKTPYSAEKLKRKKEFQESFKSMYENVREVIGCLSIFLMVGLIGLLATILGG